MPVLLTDFWIYFINQESIGSKSHAFMFAGTCTPCGTVLSPGHSSKPMSHTSCLHPHYHSQCPPLHVLPRLDRAPPLLSPMPQHPPQSRSSPGSPTAWDLALWICEIYCLSNLFFWVFQYKKHQSTSFHIVYNAFKYAQNVIMSLFYCHKCFPTSTLKGVKKIWNQRSFCVELYADTQGKGRMDPNPFSSFFMAKHDIRSGSWAVLALAEANPRAAWSAWTSASRGTAKSILCRASK